MCGVVANPPCWPSHALPPSRERARSERLPGAAHSSYGTGRVSVQSHRHMPNSMARRISEATCLLAWLGSRRTRSPTTRNARSMTRRSPPAASASSSAASLMPSARWQPARSRAQGGDGAGRRCKSSRYSAWRTERVRRARPTRSKRAGATRQEGDRGPRLSRRDPPRSRGAP